VTARKRRWSAEVRTVSTYPPPGLFTRDAETIARVMASPEVSPKGLGSGIRMVQFFINRAGRNLPARQRRELERAKRLLQARRRQEQEDAR
jgi:tRNA(adenine34) deaminase